MNLAYSKISEFDFESKHEMIENEQPQNFESIFKSVFGGNELVNDENNDEIKDQNLNALLYYNNKNKTIFIPKVDNTVKIPCFTNFRKKDLFDNDTPLINKTISLDEDDEQEEEEDEKEQNSFTGNNIDFQKSSSTSINSSQITEKKQPFQVYNSKDFNIFHPGGRVDLYKKIKNEIKDIDKLYNPKTSLLCNKFKVKKRNKKIPRRKKKEKIIRKFKPDNIRKKIKSRFFKSIKNRINQILKNAKSKEFFDLLPQCFIINITKKKNQPIMNMTFENLLKYDFITEEIQETNNKKLQKQKKAADIKKYEKNLEVIEYLKKNEDIIKKSKFDVISNMTVEKMFEEYLRSDEFEKEIVKLNEEGDDINYIKDYIVKAFGFVNYFH